MNGVIDYEKQGRTDYYVKFSCPLVQKRLFNYFSNELFPDMGKLHEPFENLDDTIDETKLDPLNLLKRYQNYLKKNHHWLMKNAPRRSDLRIYEAVYHFNLYSYLEDFLTALIEVGILNSSVLTPESLEEALPINVPLFAALKFTMEGEKPFSKIVMSLIDNEDIIHEINDLLLDSGIDITKGKIGEIFTIPISNAIGRKPYMDII